MTQQIEVLKSLHYETIGLLKSENWEELNKRIDEIKNTGDVNMMNMILIATQFHVNQVEISESRNLLNEKFILEVGLRYIKSLLPEHYEIKESNYKSSIRCISKIGIRKGIDSEDEEHWGYIFNAIKKHFGVRFKEVFHNICFCHTDFTIYLK